MVEAVVEDGVSAPRRLVGRVRSRLAVCVRWRRDGKEAQLAARRAPPRRVARARAARAAHAIEVTVHVVRARGRGADGWRGRGRRAGEDGAEREEEDGRAHALRLSLTRDVDKQMNKNPSRSEKGPRTTMMRFRGDP
jgi:hypothetical protein